MGVADQQPGDERQRRSVAFTFNGDTFRAEPGQTVAAALVAGQQQSFSSSTTGESRGLLCGMGVCNECIVTIDGVPGQRACMQSVRDGLRVESQAGRLDLAANTCADLCAPPGRLNVVTVDVAVVGAGPAGLAAAKAAAEAGANVRVIDERNKAGGQYFKQPGTPSASALLRKDRQASDGLGLIQQCQSAGVTFAPGTLVWGAEQDQHGLRLGLYGPDGASYVRPKILIIATGAYERPHPVPGWTLPGVMTTGAAQTLLRSNAVTPPGRILIAGNGPLNIQVAAELCRAGANVVGLVEAAQSPWHQPFQGLMLARQNPMLAWLGLRNLRALRQRDVPVLWNSCIEAITGDGRVEHVRARVPGGVRAFAADTVLLGGYFAPSNELARLVGCLHEVIDGELQTRRDENGRTSRPGIYVVGEAARFAGAHVALAEGRLAGLAAARELGLAGPDDARTKTLLARHKQFQKTLWSIFRPAADCKNTAAEDTMVCRCENVTLQALENGVAAAEGDVATLKRLFRAGMGRCQGRYCASRLRAIAKRPHVDETDGHLAPQMPLRPIPLAAIAVEKGEWGGHKRALLPDKPTLAADDPLPINSVETLIIGAGIAGLSTALFLSREGQEVAVIDRAYPNSLASGGNAGSLHAQLLSFDHGLRAEAGGQPALQTLPLQRESIALWAQLQREIGTDLEMKITGGIMVAENDAQMRFLEGKSAAERQWGIDCHVIGSKELRELEPSIAPHFVGAAYCQQEGKINPLIATQRIREAAQRGGALVLTRTEVLNIEAQAGSFRVTTSRGQIIARKVVNAAGAFASRIGRMVGVDVPVFGAPLQMIVTEPVQPLVSRLVAHADRHLTLKQAANGNFIVGGGWTAGLDPVHQHPRPLFESLEGNLWVAQHVVPALRKVHVIRSWAAMNINIDGAPILGEHPDCPGFFNTVTSNGYTLGPLMGALTASLVASRKPDLDLAPFSILRFSRSR
ncbi:FAD-dependent oxidoreductase [Methylovirgula sp. 4M-Z18]|uniref:FAD-dependent oxidoreductase n=1 Tax=Methylovirgula sp. 4M-Z18 TaxID=2293567 RepID=UPI000E2FED95|nr:FAD-dependent oxidoreductase [Methylovirgula sp. 4M-Z18]RFB80760.1 FAD-dependent oxidoreductase [Methylovirgula sp. 4M-Z18]